MSRKSIVDMKNVNNTRNNNINDKNINRLISVKCKLWDQVSQWKSTLKYNLQLQMRTSMEFILFVLEQYQNINHCKRSTICTI